MSRQLFPLVSADVALFSIGDRCLQVLLVQRSQEPAAGRWALPGAVLKPDVDHDLEATARRALRDKVSVEVPFLEQLRTFAGADRDPRGWSLGVLHYALLPRDQVQAVVRSKVEDARWADADIGHAADFMKRLVGDSDFARDLGQKAAADIRQQLSPALAARSLIERLDMLTMNVDKVDRDTTDE